jgi:23S rRNA (cytidine1920-2'-O)/16S rRNA (cytidine1409-2'-O)-methyltransferase
MASRAIPLIDLLKIRYPARDAKELFAGILRGDVLVAGEKVVKPGTRVAPDAPLSIRDTSPYVSRGGAKLAAALDLWSIACAGKAWIDAGCSTGGFTDCLLQRGASLVYAVDVGENQLDWRVRSDPRVRPMEGTNIMTVSRASFSPSTDSAVADLSFRSLRRAAAHILGLTTGGWGIFLVKPQFEYRAPPSSFHGVVRDQGALRAILSDLVAELAGEGVAVEKAAASPIRGRKGNREFLFLLRAGPRRAAAREAALPEDLLLE